MIICGLKLTHDGCVALIEDGKLVFSVELEKLANNSRYASIEELSILPDILKEQGYEVADVDHFALDGWGGFNEDALAIQPRLEVGSSVNKLSAKNLGKPIQLGVAQYREKTPRHDPLQEWQFDHLPMGKHQVPYKSYLHVADHLMGTYCTSPFARHGESAYILAWDGGMFPRLYFFDHQAGRMESLGPIFLLIGNTYTIFSQHFGPFKVAGNFAKDNLSVAGKVMAYIALGTPRPELFEIWDQIYRDHYDKPMGFANVWANKFKENSVRANYSDEDILATFHAYLEQMLIAKLEKKIQRTGQKSKNICLTGGCALNIKWNSALRNSGIFDEVYVPPFPNDSGSAIGAACCAMFTTTGNAHLDWSVYAGPELVKGSAAQGWRSQPCDLNQLARVLHERNEPVVFLNGRAELGPRALGNRSILAPATSPEMKDILNKVKKREPYRPVSPICLEDRAPAIFDPGTPDPYMLFDHRVRERWLDKIPAICHLDETARLQTVNHQENPAIGQLLEAYEALSGIPLLCNTSANYNGSGFFPDLRSATEWDGVNFVWSEGTLYERQECIVWQGVPEKPEPASASELT